MKTQSIGFFGDSFCANIDNPLNVFAKTTTYTTLLSNYLNAKIVNLGVGGSSVADTIILQLNPFIKSNTVPDVCIFVWTNPGRLFHRTIRNFNHATAIESTSTDPRWIAAKEYYTHLYDHELVELEYISLLEHVDNVILPKLPATTQIVHLWSFGRFKEFSKDSLSAENLDYHHTWKNGVEIRPALASVSLQNNTLEKFINNNVPNHIDTQEKNDMIFTWIKDALAQEKSS
jgi:hypothetical protein